MTESQISPQDLEQYYSSQHRVRHWITTHADHVFNSPNIPPSELDDQEGLSSAPSDVESSHSTPPRLMLRYPDGRETPIPHPHKESHSSLGRNSRTRSNPLHSSHQRSRSGSSPASPPVIDRRESEKLRSHSPEEIHVLPSASDESPPPLPTGSHHSRSRSLPRDAYSPPQSHDPMPRPPLSHHTSYGSRHGMPMQSEMTPPVIPIIPSPGPHAGLARTQPAPAPWHSYGAPPVRVGQMMPPSREHFKHSPPSIVYAPSHNSHTNYHPPAILSYRPTTGPDRIFYSHSVPPAQAQIVNAGYPSVHGSRAPPHEERVHRHKRSSESRPSSSRHRDRSAGSSKSKSTSGRKSGRDRSRSLPFEEDYPPTHHHHHNTERHHRHHARPPSPVGSVGSGSTYYVLPTARQKVHVLRSPDTLYTATSTTQSPTTPISPTGHSKRPFLQRILGGFADRFSSSGSSKGSIRRRNSTGTRPVSGQ